MFRKLATKRVYGTADIKKHFDQSAYEYREQHGAADRLLEYRLNLIRKHGQLSQDDVVLDVGCGNGHHLLAIAGEIKRGRQTSGHEFIPQWVDDVRSKVKPEKSRKNSLSVS